MNSSHVFQFSRRFGIVGVLAFIAIFGGWMPMSVAQASATTGGSQILGVPSSNFVPVNPPESQRTGSPIILGGVNLGNLTDYLLFYSDASGDANWQGATKGFVGNVAVNGLVAGEKTSGTVPYAGTISTNDSTLSAWQNIVDDNVGQAFTSMGQTALISGLQSDLNSAFTQINALTATPGYTGVSATSLDGLNTQNNTCQTLVINVTSGMGVSSKINITGDACDIYILRWDSDANFSNGYDGQVKFQSGGAIVPLGGLKATNFIHVAGDLGSSGGGSNPAAPYPQGPRLNDGQGALCSGCANFAGGGFFTGYWLTTGNPSNAADATHSMPYGDSSSLSNGIFVGGWYSINNKFSMTSGTSGVYVSPPAVNVTPTPTATATVTGTPPACSGTGVISGYLRDENSVGLSNETVDLYDSTNTTLLATRLTDANGFYSFSNLANGNYNVLLTVPTGYTAGSPTLFNTNVVNCSTPAVDFTVVGNTGGDTCGYPFNSAVARTSIVFNESEVLRDFSPKGGFPAAPGSRLKLWYNDEHTLTLGVRQVSVKTASGTTSTNYPVSPLPAVPSSVTNPQIGATGLGGTDPMGRPIYPALFVTDITPILRIDPATGNMAVRRFPLTSYMERGKPRRL